MNEISITVEWWHIVPVILGVSSILFRKYIRGAYNKCRTIIAKIRFPKKIIKSYQCSLCKDTGIIRGKNKIGRECSCKVVSHWEGELRQSGDTKGLPVATSHLYPDSVADTIWGYERRDIATVAQPTKYGYGFYSRKSDELHGTVTWLTTQGKEVEVTAVMDDSTGEGYNWDDKVYMGQVVKFVR
jgi:hypothetical protein